MNITEQQVQEFQSSFCLFGYLDIQYAIDYAIKSGHSIDWAVEQIEDYIEDTGVDISDIDCVYIVLDSILQEARNEIDDLIKVDIQNDMRADVYGNYMDSSFEWNEEDEKTTLKKKLKKHKEKLSQNTIYFLESVEVF